MKNHRMCSCQISFCCITYKLLQWDVQKGMLRSCTDFKTSFSTRMPENCCRTQIKSLVLAKFRRGNGISFGNFIENQERDLKNHGRQLGSPNRLPDPGGKINKSSFLSEQGDHQYLFCPLIFLLLLSVIRVQPFFGTYICSLENN
uniref:Uncharacterized protein n=1 Tax=Micrurus lemniscatus lemniscatus TaxID=129467 RepID=A0A2D4HPQ0_MICLE